MKRKQYSSNGWTIIELMIVIGIISIIASIVVPKVDLVMQRAYQASAKGNLGSIRTAIGLYYADQIGVYPMQGYPDQIPYDNGESLSGILCPKYMQKLPTPQLRDRQGNFNGTGKDYDLTAMSNMNLNPPRDILIYNAPIGPNLADTPFAYDARNGFLYINSDNLDYSGNNFFTW